MLCPFIYNYLYVEFVFIIISAKDKEMTNLKMALEESENKFYSIGFADAQNSCEPVMLQTQRYGIKERWLAAVAL